MHITISNAKRNLVGIYHKIKAKYLQLYLNEFIYKLNRRYFGEKIFDRLGNKQALQRVDTKRTYRNIFKNLKNTFTNNISTKCFFIKLQKPSTSMYLLLQATNSFLF